MMESAIEKYGLSIDGKVRIVNDLKSAILAIGDPVARSLRLKHLAERIDVDEAVILKKIQRTASSPPKAEWLTGRQDMSKAPTSTRGETYRLEQQMVAMMLQFSGDAWRYRAATVHGTFHGPCAGRDWAGHP
jgi:DNA primase